LRVASLVSYFFAGAFLTNGLPHLIIAITGRRNLTPFGHDSSALVNLLWSFINFAGGYLLVRYADRQANTDADSKAWLIPYEAGCLFWSLFGVLYSWFTAGQELKNVVQDERAV